jgi:hypothetical protein
MKSSKSPVGGGKISVYRLGTCVREFGVQLCMVVKLMTVQVTKLLL